MLGLMVGCLQGLPGKVGGSELTLLRASTSALSSLPPPPRPLPHSLHLTPSHLVAVCLSLCSLPVHLPACPFICWPLSYCPHVTHDAPPDLCLSSSDFRVVGWGVEEDEEARAGHGSNPAETLQLMTLN